MIKHVKETWEALDGKIFDDQFECMDYELQILYEKSGIRFICNDKIVEKLKIEDDETYNESDYITIDRTKESENDEFINKAIEWLGWSLLEDMRNGKAEKYKIEKYKVYCDRLTQVV